jgi:hypothetical protein
MDGMGEGRAVFKIREYKRHGAGDGLEVDIFLRMPDGSVVRERRKSPVASKRGATRWAKERERELLYQSLGYTKAPPPAVQRPSPRYAPSSGSARHLYVVEIGDCVKVGVTRKPLHRVAAHEKAARDHGRSIGRVWVSIAHSEALENERLLKGESRSEYLRGVRFKHVLEQALGLSYTR